MRQIFLLVMVVSVLAIPVFAQNSLAQTPVTDAKKFELLENSAVPFDISQFQLGANETHRSQYRNLQSFTADPDPVCYTMRTYFVKREDPQSDVTRVVGSSSCRLSSKFTLKGAVVDVR